ncbi:hypothetical protein PR048_031588 [Dryococelus australis]|uniref:Uncharacterized protein n=1 Tax=Dryococelus australis TaxID=614101 RepID=A0ABQ9G5Q2_9NEOP|nr:hypothetical protein PR048_031588 [Dryococelus australis]
MGYPREKPPTRGTVRQDSRLRKSGVNRPGIEPGSLWREASSLTAQPPWPRQSDRDGANCSGNRDWARNGKESSRVFAKELSQQSPGAISGNQCGVEMRVTRGEYGAVTEFKGGGNGITPRKPADQRHSPTQYPLAKIRERPAT